MVDVSKHTLVPDHTVLDQEAIEDVMEEYNIRKTDLPKIKRKDSALPSEAEVGDVVQITRNSRTAEEAVVYRLVVE